MKTAIIYESWHHENTRKLCEAIKKEYDVTLLNVKEDNIALEDYVLLELPQALLTANSIKKLNR